MIGFFDSGLGGLSTLKEWLHIAPKSYDFCYLGDQLRTPYGGRNPEAIEKFTEEGFHFLWKQGAEIIILACNTSSSEALRNMQKKYPEKKILGSIIPAVETALAKTRFGRIGVIGTRGTIFSGAYEREIQKRHSALCNPKDKRAEKIPKVSAKATPLLVPLVEENWTSKPETRMIVRKYLKSLKNHRIDTLILGCTHYGLMEKIIRDKIGSRVRIINSGKVQAEKFLDYLNRHLEIEKNLETNGKRQFFTTDSVDRFVEVGSQFLGLKIGKNSVEKVTINS